MDNSRGGMFKNKRYFDYTLLFIVLFMLAFGLVMIYSTSSYSASLDFDGDSAYYLRKQAISIGVGLFAMIVTAIVPFRFYKKIYWLAYFFAFGSVLLIMTPLGYTANGARRWLRIGGLSVQPAEICKIAVIILVAALLDKMGHHERTGLKGFLFTMCPTGLLCLMIWKMTDNLSSAIIIGMIAIIMLLVSDRGNKIAYLFLIGMILFAALVVLIVVKGWIPASASFRFARILAWLNPENYSDSFGMQTLQALYGIGSGGIWGKGLGKSMQKLGFLPEAQNDMIFSVICEELGFFGGLAVIVMFVLLLWRIRDICYYSTDSFGNLLITGVFAHISTQVLLNICVVTNLIPNTGISLPFISYGGTSVIFTLAEIGIVMNVGRQITFAPEERNEENMASN